MDRRTFLRVLGVGAGAVGVPSLLTACGEATGAIPDGPPTRNVISASYELLTGQSRRFAFGLTTTGNEPVQDADLEIYVRSAEGETLGGPYEATFHEGGGIPLGIYRTEVDLPQAGSLMIAVVDRDAYGEAAVRVVDPSDSTFAVPGSDAIPTKTPTEQDHRGVAALCTADPPCGMHTDRLDRVLADGRPAMLLFATPAYCQTAVCGPAVNTIDAVRADGDWDDLAWIHVEIYRDKGETLAAPVKEWNLPSEPWLFTIGADGKIVRRIDGPMIGEEVEGLANALTA